MISNLIYLYLGMFIGLFLALLIIGGKRND